MIKREIDDHVKALVQALLTVAKAHSIPELMVYTPIQA